MLVKMLKAVRKDEKALAGQVRVELKRLRDRKLDDKKELPASGVAQQL